SARRQEARAFELEDLRQRAGNADLVVAGRVEAGARVAVHGAGVVELIPEALGASGARAEGEVLDVVREALPPRGVARRAAAHHHEDAGERRARVLLDDYAQARGKREGAQGELD